MKNLSALEDKILVKFDFIKRDYPLFFSVIETMVRTHLASRHNILEGQKKSYFGNNSKYYLFRIVTLLKLRMSITKKNTNTYVDLRRFSCLSDELLAALSKDRVIRVTNYKCQKDKLKDLLTFNYNDFKSCLIRGHVANEIVEEFNSLIEREKVNKNNLIKIESKLRTEVLWCKRWILKNNISNLILIEDHEPRTRLLIEAAKYLGIKVYVFAHGYIQDPLYISILPLHADFIFVWDEMQKELLVNNNVKKDKVINFGYPKRLYELDLNNKKSVLFVCEPFLMGNKKNNDMLNWFINFLRCVKFDVIVRLHPKEMNDQFIINKLIQSNVLLSKENLKDDLSKACAVVGTNSSVLVESVYHSIPTFQLSDFSKCEFPGVIKIRCDELSPVLVECFNLSSLESNSYSCTLSERVKDIIISRSL